MQKFGGAEKKGFSLFGQIERKFVGRYVDKIPKSIETYHLTLMTIIWSIGVLVFSYLTKYSLNWLWVVSLMIFFQYLTDLFDGAVGRYRNTGLVKWGYYMDHFLDYIFLASIIIGYVFIFPEYHYLHYFTFMIYVGFMINSFLSFIVTNEFQIAYLKIGPTEIRLVFILANTIILLFDRTSLAMLGPYLLALAVIGLLIVVYNTQKELWKLDMQEKS